MTARVNETGSAFTSGRLPVEAIVVGASAGALEALTELLAPLPASFRLPILVVVHLSPDRKSILAELLDAKCQLEVREADDKEPIEPGTIYLAPPDYHLLVEPDKRLSLSSEEPVHYSRPSIDVLFETAAEAFGPRMIGVILTGANDDGARGLKGIRDAGGITIVQRPELAHVATMPQAALTACPEARALSLDEITTFLQEFSPPQ
jgi:two-component system chemotaxis response regulator CheB